MKFPFQLAILTLLSLPLHAAQPWREITVPTTAEAATLFAQPQKEYSAIHWAIWGGQQSKARIISDIEKIYQSGGGVYMINNSRGVKPAYLSPEYLDLVKTVVQECKQRGMKVWIEGDCGYPDGFAGGLISRDYPQLGMQGIVGDAHVTVTAGQTLDIPLPPDTLGIVANPRPAAAQPADVSAPTNEAPAGRTFPIPADGIFKYTVPRGGAGSFDRSIAQRRRALQSDRGRTVRHPIAAGHEKHHARRECRWRARARRTRWRWLGRRSAIAHGRAVARRRTYQVDCARWRGFVGSTFIRHAYRTSPTRNDNGEDSGATKDSLYTVIDFLDPQATETYLESHLRHLRKSGRR